ncbi:hypothetical protein P22_0439 [Propionispora sp. 2/2-37]|uniref:Cof-type HAD-IIB family hydrolase n=1 Tax=Propionispora sp. 2/2-37 TaxID=1677858 RepID=UPI0006BB8584|nr:Cof-type HAD-IIB family hydrolase [Propionispora sp. 2/2-37]CUH94373.1 hypothetical protein P22_0439 [Propionispora sp. 2/2-37]
MTIKLVALDLDDTLLDSKRRVSPRAKQAIRAAVAQGVMVTVATGRMHSSALPYAKQLELDVPIITYNGALIKASLSGEVLSNRPVPRQVMDEILALFREKGWYLQLHIDDVLYVKEYNDRVRLYEETAGVKAEVVGDRFYTIPGEASKMLTIAEADTIQEIQKVMGKRFAGRLSMAVSKPQYLEMTQLGVNKGWALHFLAQKLNIGPESVMAVGDSQNDLDMIEYAGWGVAMGNASERVKAAAQAVTRGHDEDGVAEAIEKYVLRR